MRPFVFLVTLYETLNNQTIFVKGWAKGNGRPKQVPCSSVAQSLSPSP